VKLRVLSPGCISFGEARALQEELAAARRRGSVPDTLLLLEHPPTVTMGRGADPAHILSPRDELDRKGISVCETDRGGDVTYHGPGQLVGYPILDLQAPPHVPDLHRYLRSIEESLIRALARFGIRAGRLAGHTGVWTGLETAHPAKVAAIGIRVSRWITQHGFALNVAPAMEHFETIVPCGIREFGVTSMERLLGRDISVAEVAPIVTACFAEVFGLQLDPGQPGQP
jgi:lipoate-protein ligase B